MTAGYVQMMISEKPAWAVGPTHTFSRDWRGPLEWFPRDLPAISPGGQALFSAWFGLKNAAVNALYQFPTANIPAARIRARDARQLLHAFGASERRRPRKKGGGSRAVTQGCK